VERSGGWAVPGDPADFDTLNFAGEGRDFDPIDWTADGVFTFTVRAEEGYQWDKVNYFLLDWGGDTWSQTWIPGDASAGVQWWMNPDNVPATIGLSGSTFPNWGGAYAPGYMALPRITPANGWMEITVDASDGVPWGAALDSFAALTHVSFQLWSGWSDDSGASGNYKVNTDGETVWPTGPLAGSVDLDNIYYTPEPATIALLGLGGLALLRKRS
jgi:hypothetical protein